MSAINEDLLAKPPYKCLMGLRSQSGEDPTLPVQLAPQSLKKVFMKIIMMLFTCLILSGCASGLATLLPSGDVCPNGIDSITGQCR